MTTRPRGRLNGHTCGRGVLWVTAVAGPITELREDAGGLVLFTEDTEVLRVFREWPGLLNVAGYHQGGDFGVPRGLVGADLRFPRAQRMALLQALNDWYASLENKNGG